MICCEDCFNDSEIKSIIKSLNIIGNCEICGARERKIYNTDINIELIEPLNALIDIYSVADSIKNYPTSKKKMLKDELIDRWNIFNISSEKVYELIKEICKDKYIENPDVFDKPVGILQLISESYLKEHSIFSGNKLSNFKEEIQKKNRYHVRGINKNVLNIYLSYLETSYKSGDIFYRGRISNIAGYSVEEMGAPPYEKALAGRINSQGIRCLYLADTCDTAICEIRAKSYDYVTVGKVVLNKDIKIIDMSRINNISPFEGCIDITQYAVNKIHLDEIAKEITKPLRGEESILDYVPTQYICDFIKSLGYDGIKYKSTMNEKEEGYNIAIFNEELVNCLDSKVKVGKTPIECVKTKVFDIRVSYVKKLVK